MTAKINICKSEWKKIWNSLLFSGFPEEYFKQGKKEEHLAEAEILLHKLFTGNVGLVADTAAGKTVMALLATLAANFRTLFLVPQINLTTQHEEMLDRIGRGEIRTRHISGSIPLKDRIWNEESDRIIFATPHVALKEYPKRRVDLGKFDLIIFDEMQLATGNYPYVPLARIASRLPVPPRFLGLSASPGENEEWLEQVEKNLSIDHWQIADIKTPVTSEEFVFAELDSNLLEIDSLFREMFLDISLKLSECGGENDPDKILTWSELEWIDRKNNEFGEGQGNDYFKKILNVVKYRKLYYAYTVIMTECYATFLGYCWEKLEYDKSRSGMEILADKRFQRIMRIANENYDSHPKALKLVEMLDRECFRGKNAIIFVSERRTGEYLKKIIAAKGYRTETVYGGATKNSNQIRKVLDEMKSGLIDYLISTSVIEMGTNVSEVKKVIQYSMPRMGISRKQRGGRTGRLEPGSVIFVALNHEYDRIFFYVTAMRVKAIRRMINEKLGKNAKEVKPPTLKKKKKKDELTLTLF